MGTAVRTSRSLPPLPLAGEGWGEGDSARSDTIHRARRLRGHSTDAERLLWSRLRVRPVLGLKWRRQHPVAGFFADFACVEAGLVVELDGSQHLVGANAVADEHRSRILKQHGFSVLRFDDRQALIETDAVLSAIHDWLTLHHPHPNPLPPAGEGANRRN